jgi:hypothetical protein
MGGGGTHIYYRLPIHLAFLPGRLIWSPDSTAGHHEVRLLGDRSLVVVPPSRHVKTGREYVWHARHSPDVVELPAEAPTWLLGLPAWAVPRAAGGRPREGDIRATSWNAPGRPQDAPGAIREQILARTAGHQGESGEGLGASKGWKEALMDLEQVAGF